MRKYLLLIVLILIVNSVQSKHFSYTASPAAITGTNWSGSIPNLTFALHPNSDNLNVIGQTKYLTKDLYGYIKFSLKTSEIPSGMSAFVARINFDLEYYYENSTMLQTETGKFLEIDYDPTNGIKYKNTDILRIDKIYDLKVKNLSIALTSGGPITTAHHNFIQLEAFIEHERFDNFISVFSLNNDNYIDGGIANNITKNYNPTNNELTINWDPIINVEGYELEYTFVDNYSDINKIWNKPNSQLNFSFRHNSTRILLPTNFYTMPVVQEKGFLVFRIRGYGMHGPNFENIFFGGYHSSVDGNGTFNLGSFPTTNWFSVNNSLKHTKDSINWQSVTTFAEEGKSKTVVKYFDGSMRERQIVTTTSAEHNAIIAETIYDFQGRPAVNILPAPVLNPNIKYYKNFNQNKNGLPYNYSNFDYKGTGICDDYFIDSLKHTSGAGNYYSSQNSNKMLFNAYIPDAEGYPFSRVTYMPDQTDRVVRQGNVGEIFQPGKTTHASYQKHDTKYYYGKPIQMQLDYLFGTDVGYDEHYQKNMVVDPNGQVSVSYVDLDGKTIATALAGPVPEGMEQLASNIPQNFTIDFLKTGTSIDAENHSLNSSQSIPVSANGSLYKFKYKFDEQTFNAMSCAGKNYCLDCIYDLEISVVNDECNKVEYSLKQTVGNLANLNFLCNDAGASIIKNFDLTLDVGTYTVTKKLTVNKQAAEKYVTDIINDPNNSCIKNFNDFYNEAWAKRDTNRCKEACQSCNDEANAIDPATAIASAIKECDSLWCNPQLTSFCEMGRMSMIGDLSPGGQYAICKDPSGNFSRNISPISIFNNSPLFGIKTFSNNVSLTNSININLPGEATHTLTYYLSSDALTKQLLLNWPNDLSEKLLPLHPEYCYLKFCDLDSVIAGNRFDTRYFNANTWADFKSAFGITSNAAANIFIQSFYSKDPFWRGLSTTTLQPQMQSKFTNFAGGQSIPNLTLFSVNCPSATSFTCTSTFTDGLNEDEEWIKFKSFYFALKQEFIQKAREEFVTSTSGCCPNDYIHVKDLSAALGIAVFNSPTNLLNVLRYPCFSGISPLDLYTIKSMYKDANKAFPNINDIDFPGGIDPNQNIYDLTGAEIKDQMQSIQSPCPTCPELEAFKMLVWQLQDKRWIYNNSSVQANQTIGLNDSLRKRIFGTTNNDNINLSHIGTHQFTITHPNCTISFVSDSVIDFQTASILPTCLEIMDYKNATLNVILDGKKKAKIKITSTCDLFYCYGTKPKAAVADNTCHCDSVYSPIKRYSLGTIVNFNNNCYILKSYPAGFLFALNKQPDNTPFWDKYCEMPTVNNNTCIHPFNYDFESGLGNLIFYNLNNLPVTAPMRYTVANSYLTNTTINLGTNALLVWPFWESPAGIGTCVKLQPRKKYKISLDVKLLKSGLGSDTITVGIILNGNSIVATSPKLNIGFASQLSYTFQTPITPTGAFIGIVFNRSSNNILAIDNFKLDCIGNADSNRRGLISNFNCTGLFDSIINQRQKTRYIPPNICDCNGKCNTPLPFPPMPAINCDSLLHEIAMQKAAENFAQYRDSLYKSILAAYYAKCLQSLETFTTDYIDAEYHYTLYYYDQSGNLVRTVPPLGVRPFTSVSDLNLVETRRNSNSALRHIPPHDYLTTYRHNGLNAVVWQQTPDAGISEFFYDALGRIVLSQNAKQRPAQKASYTTFDRLGRNVETGELYAPGSTSTILRTAAFYYAGWNSFVNSKTRTDIVISYYDYTADNSIEIAFGASGQQNLRTRIGTLAHYNSNTDIPTKNYSHATHYSYDVAGNVTDILQDFGRNSAFGFISGNVRKQSKHLKYEFDLISGKVNKLEYQKNYEDQFFYKYEYNADNKLTAALTSQNGTVWETHARYVYYLHGPLARTVLGTDKVQGTDLVYTLQGWIKGANGSSTNSFEDVGKDRNTTNLGTVPTGYNLQNQNTSADVFGYWLSYFQNDFKAIARNNAHVNATNSPLNSGFYNSAANNLYNGNIRSMYTQLATIGNLGMHYYYDQLNRIISQTGVNMTSNTNMTAGAYSMKLKYDANGNIQKLIRNGVGANPNMDDLKYHYYAGTNKLEYVKDAVSNLNYPDDVDGQIIGNYTYDAIGNLINDVKEGLQTIYWNIQNKITRIDKTNGDRIEYDYDATGQRIKKLVHVASTGGTSTEQLYVRDAQGNILAIYDKKSVGTEWAEQMLHGSSRLGMYKPTKPIPDAGVTITVSTSSYKQNTDRNLVQYELTNHLGNVLATISDSKKPGGAATLLTATDYYAFGQAMPGRSTALKYQFGFNGKENDPETGLQDYGFRIYNPGICRFLSVDPLTKDYPWYTPYQFAGNKPIQNIDLDGLEEHISYVDIYIDDKGKEWRTDIIESTKTSYVTIYRYYQNFGGYDTRKIKTEIVKDILIIEKQKSKFKEIVDNIHRFELLLSGSSGPENSSYEGTEGMKKGAELLDKVGTRVMEIGTKTKNPLLIALGGGLQTEGALLEAWYEIYKGNIYTGSAEATKTVGTPLIEKGFEKIIDWSIKKIEKKYNIKIDDKKKESIKSEIAKYSDKAIEKFTDWLIEEGKKKDAENKNTDIK